MDQKEQQLQSLGICQRLFCFIMKTLAAQALKPVTLGPPVQLPQTRKTSWSVINRQAMNTQHIGSIHEAEDSESLASIEIEDEASHLLGAEGFDWWYDQGKVIVETVAECKTKTPRKMVSIKDEPEVINGSKRRKKNGVAEQRHDGELRPLRSILKVGSNLTETSPPVVDVNAMRKATMD
ncbi:hypothetical protein BVRB_4g083370 [Beta vulgaris subsp. vulgaris]|nr:hypothetical protein BVRB_4g083370 [Beta vulgaris subsp. vulgaris]